MPIVKRTVTSANSRLNFRLTPEIKSRVPRAAAVVGLGFDEICRGSA